MNKEKHARLAALIDATKNGSVRPPEAKELAELARECQAALAALEGADLAFTDRFVTGGNFAGPRIHEEALALRELAAGGPATPPFVGVDLAFGRSWTVVAQALQEHDPSGDTVRVVRRALMAMCEVPAAAGPHGGRS
jgi:hypothetical protein